MSNTHASLTDLFSDIADAIREKTGGTGTIVADQFPDIIRDELQAASPKPYLTFTSPSSFTLKTNNGAQNWDGVLEYSTDATAWDIWDGADTLSSAANGGKHVLYLRGTGNTIISGGYPKYWVLTGDNIACKGNIENLLDYAITESGGHPSMANYCYSYMFNGCTSLIEAPSLPATTLVEACYENMFEGCTSLIKAPSLPATTLASLCYSGMFNGCTSLIEAPSLPATKLYINCYSYMFSGCTSLMTVPSLPATTLAAKCYMHMFYGCTKIKLSSTNTGEYTKAYRIPETGTGTTASRAFENMFNGTGGTFKSSPAINTTYYLDSSNTIV